MIKIAVLIGEGQSEREFFPHLLKRKGFEDLSEKQGASGLYQNGDTYWFFPFPPGLGMIKNDTGCGRLSKKETYRMAFTILENQIHSLDNEREIYLIVPFDTDGSNQEGITKSKESIENAIKEAHLNITNQHIQCVEVELETWFLAGLDETYPYFNTKTPDKKLLYPDRDIFHPKERFLGIIDNEILISSQDISKSVAEFFNEAKAIDHSPTFSQFYKQLQTFGLIK
jgi:hypothetical protein